MRLKYNRLLFAAGLDLATRRGYSFRRPHSFAFMRGLRRLEFATEFFILRSVSMLLGVGKTFMSFYRMTENGAKRTSTNSKPVP